MPTYRIVLEEISTDTLYKDIEATTLEEAIHQAELEGDSFVLKDHDWQADVGTTTVQINHERCREITEDDDGKV